MSDDNFAHFMVSVVGESTSGAVGENDPIPAPPTRRWCDLPESVELFMKMGWEKYLAKCQDCKEQLEKYGYETK